MNLDTFFQQHTDVAVAFSGGVDSTFLLAIAKKYARRCHAYYVKSNFQPDFEYREVLSFCEKEQIPYTILEFDLTKCPDITSNPSNRCYYCKRHIFSMILSEADKSGYPVVIEGTNASDDISDRPGYQALQELHVLSPLRECSLTKAEIRSLSREMNLPTADKPAYACLATRIPAGTFITPELLHTVEQSETFLMSLGFSDFRIRVVPNGSHYDAKLQITENQLALLLEHRPLIYQTLCKSFANVYLDLNFRVPSV